MKRAVIACLCVGASGIVLVPTVNLSGCTKCVPIGAQNGVPSLPNDFAGLPEFKTTAGRVQAGTASLVRLEGRPESYIVSARHLLGPLGGFDKQIAAADVPEFVQSIRMTSLHCGVVTYQVRGLAVPSKRLDPTGGEPIDDLAIYANQERLPPERAVVLAEEPPALGSRVWLVAKTRGSARDDGIMHSGEVIASHTWIIFQFDDETVNTRSASGAPVVNDEGKLVGVYTGHRIGLGTVPDHLFGFAIPAPLIAETIRDAALPSHIAN
jgi:CBS domain-containing protein